MSRLPGAAFSRQTCKTARIQKAFLQLNCLLWLKITKPENFQCDPLENKSADRTNSHSFYSHPACGCVMRSTTKMPASLACGLAAQQPCTGTRGLEREQFLNTHELSKYALQSLCTSVHEPYLELSRPCLGLLYSGFACISNRLCCLLPWASAD